MIDQKGYEKSMEINEVVQLNPHMTFLSKKLDIIEKINLRRQQRHDTLMKKLANDLNAVNLNIEKDMKISSIDLKAHMQVHKNKLNDILKSLRTPQVASYHESVFHDIQRKADEMKFKQLHLVKELYEDLCKLEDLRSNENEKIFNLSFQEIEKAAYILPYEVQCFIEHEALKMNQLSLNNRRCYEDLRLKLTLVTEETFKTFMDKVFCLKEKWVHYNANNPISVDRYLDSSLETIIPDPESRLELTGHFLHLKLTSNGCFNVLKNEEWFENVNDVICVIENYRTMLFDVQKEVIHAIQKGMSNEYDDIRKSIFSLNTLQFEERSIQPIIFGTVDDTESVRDLELHWQSTLRDTRINIQDVIVYLSSLGDLWSRHIERLHESKLLILKAIEKTTASGALSLQDLEIKLNINLDSLRQEFREAKLEAQYNAVVAILDSIRQSIEDNYVNEITIIENFYKMMNLEADILSSEIKEFIHSVNHDASEETVGESHEEGEEIYDLGEHDFRFETSTFRRKIDDFLSGNKIVKYWKSELMNALEYLSNNTRNQLAWRAERWVNSKVQEYSRKCRTQLEIHNKRYERIKIQIYDVRRHEINLHQQVFDDHKVGVEVVFKKFQGTVQNFYDISLEKLEKCREKVGSVITETKKEEKLASVRSIQTQIERQKSEFIKDVMKESEQLESEFDIKVSSVQQSNLKFMKSIKLFTENGNYDADEAKGYISSLEETDRYIINEAKSVTREIKKRESEILQKASGVFDVATRMLSQLCEELQFNADVKQSINLSKADFQEHLADLISTFDSLKKCNDFMNACITDETTCLSQKEDERWFFLINILYKNISYLFHVVEPPLLSELPSMSTLGESNESQVSENVKEQHFQAPPENDIGFRSKVEYPCKDFREELFVHSLITDKSSIFINTICRKIWSYMDYLQRLACVFYKSTGSRALIRGDLLTPNYEQFALETLEIFHCSSLQCERIWIYLIRNFLPILGNIKLSLKSYFDRKIRECAQKVISCFDDFEFEFTEMFRRNSCNLLHELQTLESKFLLLYGYPRNSHLLNSLEEEVVEKTAQLELNWELFIREYEGKLKDLHKLYLPEHREWEIMRSVYSKFKDALFVKALTENIFDFLNIVIDSEGFVKKENHKGRGEKNCFRPNMSSANPLNIEQLKESLIDASEYFSEIKKIIHREITEVTLEQTEKEQWMDPLGPKLGLLQPIETFEELMKPQLRKMKNRYRELKYLVQSKTDFQKNIMYNWLDKWKLNSEKISELFTVKYTHGEDSTEHSSNSSKAKVVLMPMAELTVKSKTKKISLSATSALPKLNEKRIYNQESPLSSLSRKSPLAGSRSSSNEKKYPGNTTEHQKNITKNRKTTTDEKKPELNEKDGNMSKTLLDFVSPGKRQSQIPVPSGCQITTQKLGSRNVKFTSPHSPVSKVNREKPVQAKPVSDFVPVRSRSPSPFNHQDKQIVNTDKLVNGRSRPFCTRSSSNNKIIRKEENEEYKCPKKSPGRKLSVESDLNCTRSCTTITIFSSRAGESDAPVPKSSKQESEGSSPHTYVIPSEDITEFFESFSKTSLNGWNRDNDINYLCDIESSKLELLDLDLEDSDSQILSTVPGSLMTTARQSFSDSKCSLTLDLLQTPKTPSGTLSTEHIFGSVIDTIANKDLENEDLVSNQPKLTSEDDVVLNQFKTTNLIEDETKHCHWQEATDVASPSKAEYSQDIKSEHVMRETLSSETSWRYRENDLLTDVNYRKFVYHPTVLKQMTEENKARPRSKSVEGRSFRSSDENCENSVGCKKNTFMKSVSQALVSDRDVNIAPLGTWSGKIPQNMNSEIYTNLRMMQNTEYILQEMKRERTKRERIAGGVLRLTAKFIHILAVLNLWPGDNFQMLISRSFR